MEIGWQPRLMKENKEVIEEHEEERTENIVTRGKEEDIGIGYRAYRRGLNFLFRLREPRKKRTRGGTRRGKREDIGF